MKTSSLTSLRACAATVALFILCATSAFGAAFIKFDGIDGEATTAGFEAWTAAKTLDFSIHRGSPNATGSTRDSSDLVYEDIKLTIELDTAAPLVTDRLVKGQVLPLVQIAFNGATQQGQNGVTYLKYDLANVLVTAFSVKAVDGETAQVTVRLAYESATINYTSLVDGSMSSVTYAVVDDGK